MRNLDHRLQQLEQCVTPDNYLCLIGNWLTTQADLREAMENLPPTIGLPRKEPCYSEEKESEKRKIVIQKLSELDALLQDKDRVYLEEFDAILTSNALREMKETISFWPETRG